MQVDFKPHVYVLLENNRMGIKVWLNRRNKNKACDKKKLKNKEQDSEKDEYEEDIIWMRRIISHNIRMPMAIIRGYGDVLMQDLLPENERKMALESICENIMYLDQVLNVIFETGETEEVLMTKVNISEVLKKVTGYVKEILRKSMIDLSLKLEKEEMYIEAELVPIMRMFYQILENSFKYLNSGNHISINVYSAENDILIVYKDDGEGISENEVKHVFEKGFRGGNSIRKIGTGYGLYEVKKILNTYHGMIEIKSHKGEGFSIFISFPKAKE